MIITTESEKSKVDYQYFVPIMAQRHADRLDLSDNEFRARVKAAYIKSFGEFCQRSKLYRVEIPVDLHAEQRVYQLNYQGWVIVNYVTHLNNFLTLAFKAYTYENSTLYLNFTPSRNITKAFYAVCAVKPRIDGDCEFNGQFVSLYSDAIAEGMSVEMSTAVSERLDYSNRFEEKIRSAISNHNHNREIRFSRRGLSVL